MRRALVIQGWIAAAAVVLVVGKAFAQWTDEGSGLSSANRGSQRGLFTSRPADPIGAQAAQSASSGYLGLTGPRADKQTTSPWSPSSMASSFSSSVKNGFNKLSKALTPPSVTKGDADPTSLSNPAKPGPEVYVALARIEEERHRVPEAEEQYRKALALNPSHLESLVGCARLMDRTGRPEKAIELYQQAAKAHPTEASVQNDLGLCYARCGMHQQSVPALARAVALQPTEKLYRNNIAMVLVDQGHVEAALAHLRAVHGESVAQYNLGYLLQKKGLNDAARAHFAKAAELDPSLNEARAWLAQLDPARGQPLGLRPSNSQTVQSPAAAGAAQDATEPWGKARVADRRASVWPPSSLSESPPYKVQSPPVQSEMQTPSAVQAGAYAQPWQATGSQWNHARSELPSSNATAPLPPGASMAAPWTPGPTAGEAIAVRRTPPLPQRMEYIPPTGDAPLPPSSSIAPLPPIQR